MSSNEYYPGQFTPANFGQVYAYADMCKQYNLAIMENDIRDPRLIADIALFRICTSVIYEDYLDEYGRLPGQHFDPYDENYDGDDE